ncbi:MAG: V-type ATP synthase subunit E [Trueperaceae bacterium]|nr:V-type ATP synthase subunit E [Trueperaceae bacterium]
MADLAALLDKEASAEIDAILAEARERASAIVADADAEAEAIVAKRERGAKAAREATLVRARSAAQLAAASTRLQAQQRAIQSVFEAVEARFADLPNDAERYRGLMDALLREAVEGVGGTPTAIRVAPGDVDLAREVATAAGVDAEVQAADDVRSGVRVVAGSVSVENTLPARLEALRDELASDVARVLEGPEA